MSSVMVQSRIKVELKEQAETVLDSIGLTTSEAIRVFLQQVVNTGGLPFTPTVKRSKTKTVKQLQIQEGLAEARQGIKDHEAGKVDLVSWEEIKRTAEARYGVDA